MSENLTLALVLGTALVDSINPCAIGVILFLSTVLIKVSNDKRLLLIMGMTYVITIYVVYMLSGLGLIWFQHFLISQGYAEVIGLIVASFIIGLGLIELKEFFWYKKWISLEIPERHKKRLELMVKRISFTGIIVLGGFVALVELPCTGGPYLAITAVLAKSFDVRAFIYLLIYNFIFVLPLIVILLMIYFGVSTSKMKKWRVRQRRWMNLAIGILLILLGGYLVGFYSFGWYL